MNIRTHLISASLLASFSILFLPTNALAVVQSLNGQTGQTQTFQNDSNMTISSSNNIHSLTWQGLLPISRGGTGASSFTNGSIPFMFGGVFSQDNSNFFWDNTNKRLGVGTSSPTTALEVLGTVKTTSLTSTTDANINTLNIGLGGGSVASNTSIGKGALVSSSNAADNTALGFVALGTSTHSGEQNTAVGSQALSETTSGSFNAGFGYRALWQNTTGVKNVAVGSGALTNNMTGTDNVALGFGSLGSTVAGGNVAAGSNSLSRNTTGVANVALGPNAGSLQANGAPLTTTSRSIYIGNDVRGYDNNDSNSIVIGENAIGAGANKTVIGNSSMTDVYFGSSSANANIRARKLFLGSSGVPGCIIIGDTAGGIGYITLDNGVLTVSSTPPSACQ